MVAGRSGRPYRRARQQVFARPDGRICHLCHHPIADCQPGETDHWPLTLDELLIAGLNPDNPDHMQPAHGLSSKCYQCTPTGWPCNYHGRPPRVMGTEDPTPTVTSTQSDGCWCGGNCIIHIDPASL